ncbi:MAG: DUF1444 family protein [Sphingobacteriales bacterium]|nr:MAG: DUF1444 family protein [Sphingobacteriales bacterium]
MNFFKKIFSKTKKNDTVFTKPENINKPFEEIKSFIYPYFKQLLSFPGDTERIIPPDLGEIDENTSYEIPEMNIVFLNICEDLNCLYVIDDQSGFVIIQMSQLDEWGINQAELHQIALENFRSLITTKLTARGDTNGIMFTIDGNLEASLVLIDEIWEQLEDQIGEPVVISVPSRDVIVATGKSNREMILNFTENSKNILETGSYPLSENWFIREGGKWQLFERII